MPDASKPTPTWARLVWGPAVAVFDYRWLTVSYLSCIVGYGIGLWVGAVAL